MHVVSRRFFRAGVAYHDFGDALCTVKASNIGELPFLSEVIDHSGLKVGLLQTCTEALEDLGNKRRIV